MVICSFYPPPKYAFHFWLTNLYHILLSLLPLHYVVRHINMVRYHLGYIPIRSAGSSISGITATAVAPYPTTTSNKVGESVLVILTLNWSASTIFHWVKGYLFHILISHSGTLWLGRFHPPHSVRDRALSMIQDMSSRKPRKAQPQYIPSSLLVVFSVSFSFIFGVLPCPTE